MKVNINPIREIRGGVITFEGNQDLGTARQIEELGLEFLEPIQVKGKVTNTGEGYLVEADLSCKYSSNCDRCLINFTNILKTNFTEEYVYSNFIDEDGSANIFQGDYINLAERLIEQVILALPMKFICREECHGFCSSCGTNLNEQSCDCIDKPINPQFEKLKSLLNIKEVD